MQTIDLWQTGVATGLLVACVLWFIRALLKGDIVLGSTHKELQDAHKQLAEQFRLQTAKQEQAAADERKVMLDRIDAQARRLDLLMERIPLVDDE